MNELATISEEHCGAHRGVVRGEDLDDVFNDLRQLEKRWKDRFAISRPFTEQYLEGRLRVVPELQIQVGGCIEYADALIWAADDTSDIVNNFRSIWPKHGEVMCHWEGEDGDQELMLIAEVQVVDRSQIIVPSRVRLQRPENIDDLWSGPVYASAFDHALKVFRVMGEWEMNAGYSAMNHAKQVTSENIERRAQVVNGIANNERPFDGRLNLADQNELMLSRFGLFINQESIRVLPFEFEDASIEVRDVFLGPLNL